MIKKHKTYNFDGFLTVWYMDQLNDGTETLVSIETDEAFEGWYRRLPDGSFQIKVSGQGDWEPLLCEDPQVAEAWSALNDDPGPELTTIDRQGDVRTWRRQGNELFSPGSGQFFASRVRKVGDRFEWSSGEWKAWNEEQEPIAHVWDRLMSGE